MLQTMLLIMLKQISIIYNGKKGKKENNRIVYPYVNYILLCNRVSPKLAIQNNKYLLSHSF